MYNFKKSLAEIINFLVCWLIFVFIVIYNRPFLHFLSVNMCHEFVSIEYNSMKSYMMIINNFQNNFISIRFTSCGCCQYTNTHTHTETEKNHSFAQTFNSNWIWFARFQSNAILLLLWAMAFHTLAYFTTG